MLGEEFVPINVSGTFGIRWVSDEVDRGYKSAVQQDVDKIAPNDGYIFTGSGKIRTLTSLLTWGENYIFVWRNPAHSVPDTIDHYFIAENDGWRAAIVTLPTNQDETVEAWLRDQFGAAVSTFVRQWGIIYPPPLDRDSDGNITVGSLSELFLGFADDSDDDRSEDAIVVQTAKQSAKIKAAADQNWVASIVIPSELDSYPLTLTWGARALQPILRERRQSAEQSVNLAFRTATGLVKAPLHRTAAVAILTQVRAGDADIVSVHIPEGIAGTLNVRDGVLGWTEIAQFAGVSSDAALSDEKLSVLTTWLRKRSVDVRLSFRCFGEFTASAESAKPIQGALSKSLRERLEWHLRLSKSGPAQYEISSLSNAAIVEAICSPDQNPTAAARRNLLLNELKIAAGGSREQ